MIGNRKKKKKKNIQTNKEKIIIIKNTNKKHAPTPLVMQSFSVGNRLPLCAT